jgi:hypothetical protein
MIGKLPKSEAWKQSVPYRPGLLLHPRYLSRDSTRIYRIPSELLHSSKLEPRNPIGPQSIPIEVMCLSYEEGSLRAGRPSSPQSLATLLIRLRLATTLRMRALQVGFPGNGVCVLISTGGGVLIGPWGSSTDLAEAVNHQVTTDWPSHVAGRLGGTASTTFLHRLGLPLLM